MRCVSAPSLGLDQMPAQGPQLLLDLLDLHFCLLAHSDVMNGPDLTDRIPSFVEMNPGLTVNKSDFSAGQNDPEINW